MKKGLLFVFIVCFINITVYAEACTTEKIKALKEIAGKLEYSYTYEMVGEGDDKHPEYTITVSNLHEDLKVLIIKDFYTLNYREFIDSGDGTGSLSGFQEGENVVVTSKAYTIDECSTKTVASKIVKLPYYNRFYDEEFCKTNMNFKYCKEFIDKKISESTYNRELEAYKKKEEQKNPILDENSGLSKFLIIGIITFVVLAIGATVFILYKRKKESL